MLDEEKLLFDELYEKYKDCCRIQFIKLLMGKDREIKELKKQIKEYKEQVNKGLYNTCLPYTTGYNKAIKDKEIQQKKFIKWLEDEINKEKDDLEKLCELCNISKKNDLAYKFFYSYIKKLEKILKKYKEIIGVSNEKES